MPKLTQTPIISTATSSTSVVVSDNDLVRRVPYESFKVELANYISENVNTGPTGPSGAPGIGVPSGGTTGQSLVKLSDANYDTGWQTITGGNENTVGLAVRNTFTATTALISSGVTTQLNIDGYKTYLLSKVSTNYPAWVRIYSDSVSRTNDLTRSQLVDPLPGAGIIAEIITTPGSLTQKITPGVIGFNDDNVTTGTIYVSITNNDVVSRAMSVTLTLLQMEA